MMPRQYIHQEWDRDAVFACLVRKYRGAYVDVAPSPESDLPHAWQGHSAQGLLGEAHQRHAAPNRLDGLDHADS